MGRGCAGDLCISLSSLEEYIRSNVDFSLNAEPMGLRGSAISDDDTRHTAGVDTTTSDSNDPVSRSGRGEEDHHHDEQGVLAQIRPVVAAPCFNHDNLVDICGADFCSWHEMAFPGDLERCLAIARRAYADAKQKHSVFVERGWRELDVKTGNSVLD